MAKKTKHFKSFSIESGDVSINVSFERFGKQFNDAQFALDNAVMTSMLPYMPMNTGDQIHRARAESAALAGSGLVVAAVPPQGRFLYYGKVMVDPVTNSPWARKGAKKVVTERDLTYSNPKATPKWFDTAKKKDGKAWVKTAKKIAGGGHGK